MSASVDILTEASGWERFDWLPSATEATVAAALSGAGIPTAEGAEISLLLCDDARIRELNAQWRGMDKPTNVLSFPAADPDDLATAPLLGDIAVALETVTREAQDEGKTFRDHYTHLIVHGTLHLLGFDHEVDEDAEEMEDMERRILKGLGIADPYADAAQESRRP
jgi:probable rRNA maturation factor